MNFWKSLESFDKAQRRARLAIALAKVLHVLDTLRKYREILPKTLEGVRPLLATLAESSDKSRGTSREFWDYTELMVLKV